LGPDVKISAPDVFRPTRVAAVLAGSRFTLAGGPIGPSGHGSCCALSDEAETERTVSE